MGFLHLTEILPEANGTSMICALAMFRDFYLVLLGEWRCLLLFGVKSWSFMRQQSSQSHRSGRVPQLLT